MAAPQLSLINIADEREIVVIGEPVAKGRPHVNHLTGGIYCSSTQVTFCGVTHVLSSHFA
jgi:hypothetical protein